MPIVGHGEKLIHKLAILIIVAITIFNLLLDLEQSLLLLGDNLRPHSVILPELFFASCLLDVHFLDLLEIISGDINLLVVTVDQIFLENDLLISDYRTLFVQLLNFFLCHVIIVILGVRIALIVVIGGLSGAVDLS